MSCTGLDERGRKRSQYTPTARVGPPSGLCAARVGLGSRIKNRAGPAPINPTSRSTTQGSSRLHLWNSQTPAQTSGSAPKPRRTAHKSRGPAPGCRPGRSLPTPTDAPSSDLADAAVHSASSSRRCPFCQFSPTLSSLPTPPPGAAPHAPPRTPSPLLGFLGIRGGRCRLTVVVFRIYRRGAAMSSPNDSGAPAPGASDGAPDAPTESEADGEVTELFTMTDTGLCRVSAAILPGASSVSCLECFSLPHLRCRILTDGSFALRRLFPRLFCVGRFFSQESKKTTVEKVCFHSGGSSAAYFETAPRGAAHVRYLAENAVKTFWKDSPTT